MPCNTVIINGVMGWEVYDSSMDALIEYLNCIGERQGKEIDVWYEEEK